MSKYGEKFYGYYEIKKSKFHTYIFEVSSLEEIEKYINIVKKDNNKAKHILYAYDMHINETKYSKTYNDKEPIKINYIHQIMENNNIVDYLVIVVRYFGGTLLGKGNLHRSYYKSFVNALLE